MHVQDLRPQDSIPFLRRVSADLHKNNAVRHIANIDLTEPPLPERPNVDRIITRGSSGHPIPNVSSSPVLLPSSPASPIPPLSADTDILSVREHTFVKTTFSKRKTTYIEAHLLIF